MREVRSASDGRFVISMMHAPFKVELKLAATKDGYEPFNKTFASTDNIRTMTITMTEAPEPPLTEIQRSALSGLSAAAATDLAQSMCRQLPNSAAFPFKGSFIGDDVHDTLVLLGRFSVPCLIDRITDYTWMPDPREDPLWGDFRAGDAAFFILCDAGVHFDAVVVPMVNKKRWNEVGVYAYFEWINQGDHRRRLQQAVRSWLERHPLCCDGREGPSGNTEPAPAFKIAPEKFAALRQQLAGIRPGMDEKSVREMIGPPDFELDLERIGEIISLNRREKSAVAYLVQAQSDLSREHAFQKRRCLQDRYLIVFFTEQGKLARVFSNVDQLPPIYPQNRKLWLTLMYGKNALRN